MHILVMFSSRLFAAFSSPTSSRIAAALYRRPLKCPARRLRPFAPHPITATLSSTANTDSVMGLGTELPDNGGTYQGEILCNRALNMANIAAVGVSYTNSACVASPRPGL